MEQWAGLGIFFSTFVGSFITMNAIATIALYVIARWRNARDPVQDPQIGLKFVINLFSTWALQLVLAGLALALYTRFSSDIDAKSTMYRAAFALLLPACVVLAAHLVVARRTNQARFPGIRLLFIGYNLLIVGMIGLGALLVLSQALCAKESFGDTGKVALAITLIYGAAWAVIGWRYFAMTINAEPPAAAPTKSIDLRVSI